MNNHLHPLFKGILSAFTHPGTPILTDQEKIAAYGTKHADKDKPEPLPISHSDMSIENMALTEQSLVKQSEQANKN